MDPAVQGRLWQLEQKIQELEGKLDRIQRVVMNIDGNTAQTANMVREILRKK